MPRSSGAGNGTTRAWSFQAARCRHLAAGQTPQQIAEEYPELTPDDVLECLRYAAWLASGRALELSPAA